MPRTRNTDPAYVTATQAAEIANVAPSTPRNWLRKGLISAIRVGNGPFLYRLADVEAMRVEYPRDDVDERIAELVAAAPELSVGQINQLRLLLHATPASSGGDTG